MVLWQNSLKQYQVKTDLGAVLDISRTSLYLGFLCILFFSQTKKVLLSAVNFSEKYIILFWATSEKQSYKLSYT